MHKYGDLQLGAETGDAHAFKSWEDLWEAYKTQHILFLKTAFIQQYLINNLRARHFAQPMGEVILPGERFTALQKLVASRRG